jgi:hypothetical protein
VHRIGEKEKSFSLLVAGEWVGRAKRGNSLFGYSRASVESSALWAAAEMD